MERALIGEYTALVDQVLSRLTQANRQQAAAILWAHDKVRGYDQVKEASVGRVRATVAELMRGYGPG
jgi:indolepyruvate ferredoxin oxidoreductase